MIDSMEQRRPRRLARVPEAGVYWDPRPTAARAPRILDRAPACPRQALAAAAARKSESYAGLSQLLGHGRGYLHRFVQHGIPRALTERDHQILADYLGVSPRELGVRDLWVCSEQEA